MRRKACPSFERVFEVLLLKSNVISSINARISTPKGY